MIQQCDFIIQLRTKDSALLPFNLMVQLKSLAVGIGTVLLRAQKALVPEQSRIAAALFH